MPTGAEVGELAVAIFATLLLPLAILTLDYYIRAKVNDAGFQELVRTCGPDCCILSLGSTGAIFLDPRVSALHGKTLPIVIIVLFVFLIFMRIACINKATKTETTGVPPENLRYGVFSILAVSFVICIGYLASTKSWSPSPSCSPPSSSPTQPATS